MRQVTIQKFWDDVIERGTHKGGDQWLYRHIDNVANGADQLMILDLGCGHGLETDYLLRAGHQVLSADFSQGMLAKMHATVPGSQGIRFDMESDDWTQFRENQFDVIVASSSLHYFKEEVTVKIVGELRRILKPKGKLIARVNSVSDIIHGAGDGELVEENFYIDRTRGIPKRYFDLKAVKRFFAPLGSINIKEVQGTYNGKPKMSFEFVVVNGKTRTAEK